MNYQMSVHKVKKVNALYAAVFVFIVIVTVFALIYSVYTNNNISNTDVNGADINTTEDTKNIKEDDVHIVYTENTSYDYDIIQSGQNTENENNVVYETTTDSIQSENEDENLLYYESGKPFITNIDNPIPDDYDPDLVDIGNGQKLNRKAAAALEAMMKAAKEDGVSLTIISAYRSNERQTNNFNNKINQYLSQGFSKEEAYIQTARYIAVPGTSEHTAGLAVDFNLIEDRFDKTPEYEWLINHCTEFGFILRYRKETESITKIAYEPWHYRYVGTNHAVKIHANDIALEEYIQNYSSYND